MLQDIPPDALLQAVERYLNEDRKPFFPGPGELRSLAAECTGGEILEWQEAWALIMEACEMWDQNDKQKAIAARRHVGDALYAVMKKLISPSAPFYDLKVAGGDTLEVIKSNFRNGFTNQRDRNVRDRALPEHLRPKPANLQSDKPPARKIEDLPIKTVLTEAGHDGAT